MAEIERLSDTCFELDGKIRVEQGPALKTAEATEELLSDAVTAGHYQAPQEKVHQASGKTQTVYSRDALGRPIKLGEEMSYLDWLGDPTWYIYAKRWEPVVDANGDPVAVDNEPQMQERWVEIETIAGEEDDALDRAEELLSSEE